MDDRRAGLPGWEPRVEWSYPAQPEREESPRLGLHLALFLATVATTLFAGALLDGADVLADPRLLYRGIPFSLSLLLILGVHETAHYLMSRRHGLKATLPFFIPAPTLIGTMGAVIRIKSPIHDRRALLDIGVSGPLAGFLLALPVTAVGLGLSRFIAELPEGEGISLGSSLLFALMEAAFAPAGGGEGMHLVLHPVAFAGWVGLLVTAMNLIPVGQLDGGHVVCALFGPASRILSLACLAALVPLGIFLWPGWLVWAAVLLLMGWRHPLPAGYWIPLDRRRRLLGMISMAVLVLTFTPAPFPFF